MIVIVATHFNIFNKYLSKVKHHAQTAVVYILTNELLDPLSLNNEGRTPVTMVMVTKHS